MEQGGASKETWWNGVMQYSFGLFQMLPSTEITRP